MIEKGKISKINDSTKLNILKLFIQISSSRMSIITKETQRCLFKRLNNFTLCVFSENSNLSQKKFQTELVYFCKKLFCLYGEVMYMKNKSYSQIIWRAVLRIIFYTLISNAEFFDEELVNKVWDLLDTMKKKKMHDHLFNTVEKPSQPVQSFEDNSFLFSGKPYT